MMTLLKRIAAPLILMLSVAGCQLGQPDQMVVSFSAYTDRPVVLTEMTVNGTPMSITPKVIRGRADRNRPRVGSGRSLLGYPSGESGTMDLGLTWVELPSGNAYSTQVDVPLSELLPAASGGVEFMPVFAPGGLLLITSDPVPESASDTRINDVVQTCAARAPAADQNFAANPGALPALREAIAAAATTPATTPCNPT